MWSRIQGGKNLFLAFAISWAGCGVNSTESFKRDLSSGNLPGIEQRLKSDPSLASQKLNGGDTPLHWAVICQRPKETIELLLRYRADINAKETAFGLTPLHKAAWSGRTEAVRVLIAHGADVNAFNEHDSTALNYAVTANSKEIVELLLAAGAGINRGYSVLLSAENKPEMMEFLLARGANPNTRDGNSDSLLARAIIFGNTNTVATLLAFHPDLGKTRNSEGTPLESAIHRGNSAIVSAILQSVLQKNSNTIHHAAVMGDTNRVTELLRENPPCVTNRDELGFTPLHWAAEAGQLAAAHQLLAAGADVNAPDAVGFQALDLAAFMGHLPLVKLFARSGASDLNNPLLFAIRQSHLPVARFLLEKGADDNAQERWGQSALHIAAGKGDVECVRLLLDHGARVNATEINKSTPLEFAITGTSKEVVDLLLEKGADVGTKSSKEMNAFHLWAIGAGEPGIADLLFARQADVNARDYDGKTPLHHAVNQGQKQAVEWLLKHGAEVNVRDKNGRTPIDLLKGRRGVPRRKDVAELLQGSGAKQ